MAAKNNATSKIEMRSEAEIYFPWEWNGRSSFKDDTTHEPSNEVGADNGKTLDMGDRGWLGILFSVAQTKIRGEGEGGSGIRDPLLCRPNPWKNQKGHPGFGKALAAVQGFTRGRSALHLAYGDKVKGRVPDDGTDLAALETALLDNKRGALTPKQRASLRTEKLTFPVVVQEMTEAQAIYLNTAENVQRNALTPQDKAHAVIRMHRANPDMTDTELAIAVGMTQGYASRIMKFAKALDGVMLPDGWASKDSKGGPLLDLWRTDPKRLGPWDMLLVSQAKGDKATAYIIQSGRKAADPSKTTHTKPTKVSGDKGPAAWVPNVVKQNVPVIAAMLIALQREGFIEINEAPTKRPVIDALLVATGKDPSKKKDRDGNTGLTPAEYSKIGGALQAAMTAAAQGADAADAAEGAAMVAAASAPATPEAVNGAVGKLNAKHGKGKGKGASAQA